MLTSTYVHLSGIGDKTERELWRQGATDWTIFLHDPDRWKLTGMRRATLELGVDRSLRALDTGHYQYFAQTLPPDKRWRAFSEFNEAVGYLDIETNGGVDAESVTIIGLYAFGKFDVFVKGDNLASFADALERCSTLVTYFGTGFDIPMLKKAFPYLPFDQLHIDLCPALRRLGHRGGLKRIEEQLGIQRSPETVGLSGMDAVYLWRRYLRGSESALDTLVAYNREDCVNLERLMHYAYNRLADECRCEMTPPKKAMIV